MNAPTEATVVNLFKQLEPQVTSARSRQKRIDDLLALHEVVARRYAEHAHMLLSSQPDFIKGTLCENDLSARMRADFDALVAGAAKVREAREAREANDDVTRLLAEARLIHAYYGRYNAISLQACLTPRGGSA